MALPTNKLNSTTFLTSDYSCDCPLELILKETKVRRENKIPQ